MLTRVVILAVVWLCGGCAERKPSEPRVEATNINEYNWWRALVAARLPPDVFRDFKEAIIEIRFQLSARGAAGQAAIDEAMCRQLDGRTVEEVLRMGDEARLARLVPARDRLKLVLDSNVLLATLEGDEETAAALAEKRRLHQEKLRQIIGEIEDARRKLITHGGTPPPATDFDAKPRTLAREEALHEFGRMIRERLELAEGIYGDWPARIDPSGADLSEEERSDFELRKRDARLNHHTVLPVYVRTGWWMFDKPVRMPEFTEYVTGNLTQEDRDDIARLWAASEAEIWARRKASRLSPQEVAARTKEALRGVLR